MIKKETSSTDIRGKSIEGHPPQQVDKEVTTPPIEKEKKEKSTESLKQENNRHVAPTSSRQSVEVDKIYNLLRSSNTATRERQQQKKHEKRIEEIVNETSEKLHGEASSAFTHENNKTQSTPLAEKEEKIQKEEVQKSQNPVNPDHRDKEEEHRPKNGFLKFALLIALIIIAYLIYDKKNKIETTFSDLPVLIQEQYIQKKAMSNTQKQLNLLIEKSKEIEAENSSLKKQIDAEKITKNNTEDLTKSLEHNKKLLNQVEMLLVENSQLKNTLNSSSVQTTDKNYSKIMDKEIFPAEKSTSKDYKIVKCYDLKAGSFFLTPTCKRDITKFLTENKTAKRFEIIGVVDNQDFTILTGKTKVDDELQKFLNMGLARYRVLETSWIVTQVLGEDIVLSPANYSITSKKNNRGSIIRAYY